MISALLWGCIRRGQVPELADPRPPGGYSGVGAFAGPTLWSEGPGGLCWTVPEGWIGASEPGGDVALTHADSGVVVRLGADRWPGERFPDPPGLVRLFEDDGAYRTVPLLFPAATATWRGAEGEGPTVQRWWGRVGDRRVWLEVVAPDGALLRSDLLDPVLTGVCRSPN
jgi:hypothetical protein